MYGMLLAIHLRVHGKRLLTWVVGKTLAYTNIKFTNAKGEVVARGSHTK